MQLEHLVISNVNRAFQIVSDFTPLVTFQMQIVFNINPINDSERRVPTVFKTVPAVQWKNVPTRNDLGGITFKEMVVVQQWNDVPGPTDSDLLVDPDGAIRQIETVEPDPAKAVWMITLRGPTAQT
jgi:hypothetical protein